MQIIMQISLLLSSTIRWAKEKLQALKVKGAALMKQMELTSGLFYTAYTRVTKRYDHNVI